MIEDQKDPKESPNDALLREIREDYTYFRDYWRENQNEMLTDLQFVAGDPWDNQARKEREDNGRPVLCPDELDQYLNQAINNLRQNKRAIKVTPNSGDATDEDAERRASIIRRIEYDSKAQAAYINAFENGLNCGMGFFRLSTKVVSDAKEVEPCVKIIENPLSVLPDPNAKETDFSDQQKCFVFDVMRQSDFARKYPRAQKKSFTPEDSSVAPGWFQGQNIVVAEYWKLEGEPGSKNAKVTQYITNGLEILEKTPWAGWWVPVIVVTGKKVYKPHGDGVKRFFYSMIRKARGAQQMLAYIASQEAEEYGMAPRAPFVGYVGQFETDKDAWDLLNKVPRAYVQTDPVVDQATGQILPPPTRPAFVPNAQAYEIGKESWRRSIQASMGITPLPTAAQRQNEKSGVALERIETAQSIGSFHFTDNFDLALENAGRQLNQLITAVIDTPRQVGVRQPDDTHNLLHVVPGGKGIPANVSPDEVLDPQKGDFGVTVSTGPSYQSQREEASAFVDLLTQQIDKLPPPGSPGAMLLAKAITLKNLGPVVDDIAKILDPQADGEPIPPQARQAIAVAQQQAQMLQGELQKLMLERQGKVIEHQGKMQQIAAQSQADMTLEKMKLENALAIAEVETKAQNVQERLAAVEDMMKQFHAQAHDVALQAHQQAHEQQMQAQAAQQQQALAQQQADNASMQSAQDAAQSQASQSDGGASSS